MTSWPRFSRLAPQVLLSSLAMSCKPPPAEEFHYTFLFPRGEVPLGAVLMFGETELGEIHPGAREGDGDDRAYARAAALLPRSAGPISAAPGALRARRKGACGDSFAALKVLDGQLLHARKANDYRWSAEFEQKKRADVDGTKPELRYNWKITVPIDWVEPPADTSAPVVAIYVDDHGASPPPVVTIGTLEVKRDDVFKTQALGCSKSFSVKAGGAEIGKLEVSPTVRAYVISTRPACYRERLITYSSANDRGPTPSSSPTIHGPGTVIPLTHAPNFFLKPAPGTARGGGTSSTVAEVTETPCPSP